MVCALSHHPYADARPRVVVGKAVKDEYVGEAVKVAKRGLAVEQERAVVEGGLGGRRWL